MQAVMMMKIPRANNVVSIMTPMISSQREQKPRHSHTNAYIGTNASLDEQGIAPRNVKLNRSRINAVPSRFFRQKIVIVSF